MRQPKRTFSIVMIVLCSYLFIPWTSYGQELVITVLDVGQGDSILIQAPQNYTILVDGGPDQSVVQELEAALPFWDRTIEALIPTHPDADHIGGLVAVLRRYNVRQVMSTPVSKETQIYQSLMAEIERQQIPVHHFTQGQVLQVNDHLVIRSLWPSASNDWDVAAVNNLSQVHQLEWQNFSALLTGDIDTSVESDLMDQGLAQPVTMLKIPHHGSKSGLSLQFVQQIEPAFGVVSVGADNRYGHPAANVERMLQEINAEYFRTDQQGRVTVVVNQAGYSVATVKMKYN